MSWPRAFSGALLAAITALAPTAQNALAQSSSSSACSYEECALRVRFGFFGESLVRGAESDKVRDLDFWIGSLDEVFEGSTAAQDLAATFRRRHNTGTVLTILGIVGMVSEVISTDFWENDDTPGAGFWSGIVLGAAGGIFIQTSRDPLSRAVWEYNRGLER
jgi:hypothetical protein